MTIDSLINALNQYRGYQGGVVLVSHDARFIDRVCNELWICNNLQLTKFSHASNETVLGMAESDGGKTEGTSGIMEYKRRILREFN
jgi:ATPase subunit of ABC transporter with duplicated ATPase domains